MNSSAIAALIGHSPPMQRLRALVARAAPTRLSILIEGPTGSGKELVAAALHEGSGCKGSFVAFNVAAIGESMFEDALFGHVRGAFTGASGESAGLLREANGGTAFFDEISGLPVALQVKLLRAIDTGQFRPIGARADCRSDFRVVAATNEATRALMEAALFRADLLHRICAVEIHVPDLAEHIEDVPLLVRHFLDRGGFSQLAVTDGALRLLQDHEWPGNVRELKNAVEWSAALAEGTLDEATIRRALSGRDEPARSTSVSVQESLALRELLGRHEWDTGRAAQELGIHRATLYRRMRRWRVAPPSHA